MFEEKGPTMISDLALGKGVREYASTARSGTDLLRFLSRAVALELLAYVFDGRGTCVSNSRGVAKVGVDASDNLAIGGLDILNNDVPSALRFAVTTTTVEFAKVVDGETIDGDCANTVVLNHLVFCVCSSAANDDGISVTLQ